MPSWKKLIVSGSDASLSSLTATSYGGNISGSATSTGSFGAIGIGTIPSDYKLNVEGTVRISGTTLYHNTNNPQYIWNSGNLSFRYGTPNSNSQIFRLRSTKIESLKEHHFTGGDILTTHDIISTKTNGLISGSATSTGSFGHLLVGGSELASSPDATDGSQSTISGSSTSTGSFGTIRTGTTIGSLSSGISFGDGDTGIYEKTDDNIIITAGNSLESLKIAPTAVTWRTDSFNINTSTNTFYGIRMSPGNSANTIYLAGSGAQTIDFSKFGALKTSTTMNSNGAAFSFQGTMDQIASFSATSQFVKLDPVMSSSNAVATSSYTMLDMAGTIDMTGQTQETIRSLHIHPTKTNIVNYTAIDADGDIITTGNISGSATSTGSFGHIQMSGRNFPPQLFTTGSSIYMGDGGTGLSDDGSGNDNVGIGTEVLTGIANGAHNVAIGNNALKARTVGSNNIAIGQKAGGSDADDFGSHNILMGENAGLNINNTGTSFNVMIGQSAGMAITNAYKNTFVGNSAGSTITTGTQNVAIGNNAGGADGATAQTNTRSIFVGDAAKASADGNTNEIVIGKTTTGKGSNTVTIGNDDTTDFYITEGTQATLHTGTVSGSSTSTGSFGAIQSAGNITPKVDDSVDLGASNLRFKNIFTTDLQLSNEGKEKGNEVDGTTGSWTIQEGEEELYLLNRKNGKKYKFMLQEIK